MAFRFRLAPVLRQRRWAEDMAALDFAHAQRLLAAAQRRLAVVRAEVLASQQALAGAAGRGSTGVEIGRLARTIDELHASSLLAAAETAGQRERVERARAKLARATHARQVLQQLEDGARAAHARHIATLEQRMTEDVAAAGQIWRQRQDAEDTA